jgi:fatty acid desaturase
MLPTARARRGLSHRTTAIVVGAMFIAGDIAAVMSGGLTSSLFKKPGYLIRIAARENRLAIGVLCLLAAAFFLAIIPIVMYPIFRRFNQAVAVGYRHLPGSAQNGHVHRFGDQG